MSARFCLECGAPIWTGGRPPHERKVVTAVFIDIVGSEAAADGVDPEDVAGRLVPYYEQVRAALERYGGTVEKFVGDTVVAIFGAPIAHEDDSERAVRGALAAFDAIAALNAKDESLDLKIRVGINTGEALVDLGARSATGEGIAYGDVMNAAARLQAAAPVNGILVGALTHEATHEVVEYRDAGTIEVKGKSEPLPAWELIALRRRETTRRRAAFVGREGELTELADLWRAVCKRQHPAFAAVLGPPGIGKTRLLTEFADGISFEAAVISGRCLPYGEGITYWPVAEIVERAAGIMKSDAASAAATKVSALLDRLEIHDGDERGTIAAAVSSVIGASGGSAELSRAELHWGLRRMLQLLSLKRPLMLVVEDLHWAEPTLLELLRYLVEDKDAAYLLIGSSRVDAPDLVRSFVSSASLSVRLQPLTDEASRALLTELAGPANTHSTTGEVVLRTAAGNPLFLEETVRMLHERGQRWDIDHAAGDALPVPTSLQALIGSRIDRLPENDKRIAQIASVTGEVFWAGALAYLLGGQASHEGLEYGLVALERGDFVHRRPSSTLAGENEYAFKHVLIRDVAYAGLPKASRMELHMRFAEWVQALGKEELVEIVAWHLERSCRLAAETRGSSADAPLSKAVAALSLAGEKATRRQGWREAEGFLARALELVDETDEEFLQVRIRYSEALLGVGHTKKALELAVAAKEEALIAGRLELAAEAIITLCHIARRRGDPIEARLLVDELHGLAGQLGDRRLDLKARYMSASIRGELEGALDKARDELRQGIAIAKELGDQALLIDGHLRLGFILVNIGELEHAEVELQTCSALAVELGNGRDHARAICPLATIRYLRGETEKAEQLALQAAALLERTGETFFQIQNLVTLAQCALARGDAEAAEDRLRSALATALHEDSVFVAEICRLLIDALIDLNRLDEASDIASFADRRVQHKHEYTRAAVQMGESALAAATGDLPTAIQRHQAALATLEELGVPIDLNQARLAYGSTLRESGEDEEARRQLELARRAFEEMGATGLLSRAEHELALLNPARLRPGPATG